MTTVDRIKDPVKVKLQRYKLMDLSYKMMGELQVRKETLETVVFYHSSPYGQIQRNIVCRWSRGFATIPKEWVDSV